MLSALYGTEVVEFRTFADSTESTAMARKPDGYWYGGDRWAHRGVSAVLVVKNLHPAFVGTQQHTIWEHPDPEVVVDEFPIWRRSVVEDGNMTLIEPVCFRPTGSASATRGPWVSPSRARGVRSPR